ncbi:MAG: amidohydrolase family protein [Planctomycetota bacterium]|jgi:imidazolonepropionase-like amidohydrolase|nr:amidohydrolase family protein [Planctomycetota bacterium]MDP6940779.1 amidohydrolase family protein [Planctomycetota bacterium]
MIFASFFLGFFAAPQAESITLSADLLHDGRGNTIENAIVEVEDGKIISISTGKAPKDSIYVESATLTPGLVDAYSLMGVNDATVEQRRESTPSLRLSLSADLDSPSFARAAGQGVTSAFVTPDSLNVIGGLGMVVKTSGGQSSNLFASGHSAAKVLSDSAGLKISLGSDASRQNRSPWGQPSDVFIRRPTTRMGVTWVIRRQFHAALAYRKARAAGEVALNHDMEVLVAALEGEIPVRVHARRAHDIQTALRLREEFGWPFMIIEEGTESHKIANLLAEAGIPVVLGPAYTSTGKSLTNSPTLEELRQLASPPAVCCEHEHEEEDREGTGIVSVDGVARDILLLAVRPSEASGLSSGRWTEGDFATPATAGLLENAGTGFALGSAEAHDAMATEASLIHQARQAVRWGLSPEAALAACTSIPAALCGLSEQTGSIEPGMDADLVLWSGDPLDASSSPLIVLIDGKVVLDRRAE